MSVSALSGVTISRARKWVFVEAKIYGIASHGTATVQLLVGLYASLCKSVQALDYMPINQALCQFTLSALGLSLR